MKQASCIKGKVEHTYTYHTASGGGPDRAMLRAFVESGVDIIVRPLPLASDFWQSGLRCSGVMLEENNKNNKIGDRHQWRGWVKAAESAQW